MLALLLCGSIVVPMKGLSQPIRVRVPVGEQLEVFRLDRFMDTVPIYCSKGSDICVRIFAGFGWLGHKTFDPQFYVPSTLPVKIIFRPTIGGTSVDTFTYHWQATGPGSKCENCESSYEIDVPVEATAFYDSMVKIRGLRTFYLIAYDTIRNRYGWYDNDSIRIFNNVGDSLQLDSVMLSAPSGAQLSMRSFRNGQQFSTSAVAPLNIADVGLHLRSTAALFPNDTFFYGQSTIHLRGTSFDTTVTVVDTFFFFGAEPSLVPERPPESGRFDMTVRPNPSVGPVTIEASADVGTFTVIEIFDELGRRVQTVFQGIMNATPVASDTELESGTYFVRMQSGSAVVTKRIVVKK